MLTFDKDTGTIQIHDQEMFSFLTDLYRETNRLSGLPDEKLDERLNGILGELIKINSYGKPYLNVKNKQNSYDLVEVIAEYNDRNIDINQSIKNVFEKFDNVYLTETDIQQIERKLAYFDGKKCLFKFTASEHVEKILNGEVRFCSASSYNKKGYNIAISDDELNMWYKIRNLRIVNEKGDSIPALNNQIEAHAFSDYWISCFSKNFAFKLFALFEYDSCVVISNAEEFIRIVKKQFKRDLPSSSVISNCVEYQDVTRHLKSKHPIELRKPSHYSFEEEYRFVAYPNNTDAVVTEVETIEIDPSKFEYCVLKANPKNV